MGKETGISWTDATWNIARGCSKVDADCLYCYMYRESMNSTRYNPVQVVRTKTVFDMPLKYKNKVSAVWSGRPLIFTSSLTDFFHESCDGFRDEAWDIIRRCPHLIFQILTKRPERIVNHLPDFWNEIKERVWLGTSVGSQSEISRALDLIKLRSVAQTLFLSLEPMHSEINFRWSFVQDEDKRRIEDIPNFGLRKVTSQHELLINIDWVIVGGESGNENGKYRYRPCRIEWIDLMVQHCKEASVPIFIKQLGTHLSKERKMSDRHGSDINEFPVGLQLRQFPRNAEAHHNIS